MSVTMTVTHLKKGEGLASEITLGFYCLNIRESLDTAQHNFSVMTVT